MVSISDSVSAVAGRPARGSLSGWGVGQGRVPGPLAQPVASWPAVSCGGGGPAPRQALCSAARLGLLPDQPALGLSLGWFSPSLSLCPVPAQPSAASPPAFGLPGILTPRSAIMGSRRMTGPLGLQPCRLPPAGWPLSHRFHRSRFRFPAPLPSLPSLILVRVQLAQCTTAKQAGSPCLHLCTLLAKLRPPPFWAQGFGAPLPPVLGGVGITLLEGCLWHPPCSLRPGPGGESPLFNDWVCLPPPHSLRALQILLPQPLLPCLGNFRPQPNFPSSARPA